MNEIQTECFKEILKTLNSDQGRIFEEVKNALVNESEYMKYIGGNAGAGKSYLIRAISNFVRMFYSSVHSCGIVAFTGLAANQIDGSTIHRYFGLPVENPKKKQNNCELENIAASDKDLGILQLKVLLLDEVSMISSKLLTKLNNSLQDMFENNNSFGGVKIIIFFGDLMQLPPVDKNSSIIYPPYIFKNKLWQLIGYDELTIRQRHSMDENFANALDEIRYGKITTKTISLLSERISRNIKIDSMKEYKKEYEHILKTYNQDPVCLFPRREMIKEFNKLIIQDFKELIKIPPIDNWEIIDKSKLTLEDYKSSINTSLIFENSELCLAKGCRVMLIRNIDVNRGLYNGALGRVIGFECINNLVQKINIKFDDVEEIETIVRFSQTCTFEKAVRLSRFQFPITLSYALTYHKSQGLTLSSAMLYIGEECFGYGQIYSGLSRVKTLKDLYIIKFTQSKIKASPECMNEINRLRSMYRIDLPLINIPNCKPISISGKKRKRV